MFVQHARYWHRRTHAGMARQAQPSLAHTQLRAWPLMLPRRFMLVVASVKKAEGMFAYLVLSDRHGE